MNIVALIQAREGSTRFPGKVMADLNGQVVIHRVLRAAQRIEGVSLAKVIWPEDYPLVEEENVLGRYHEAARQLKADVIIRLTGDCPLFDPQVGTLLLRRFLTPGMPYEYVSNVWPVRTWPDGMDCEIFTKDLLLRVYPLARKDELEHVTPAIRREAKTWYNEMLPVDWSFVRLTLDSPEDLEWLKVALKAPRSF